MAGLTDTGPNGFISKAARGGKILKLACYLVGRSLNTVPLVEAQGLIKKPITAGGFVTAVVNKLNGLLTRERWGRLKGRPCNHNRTLTFLDQRRRVKTLPFLLGLPPIFGIIVL